LHDFLRSEEHEINITHIDDPKRQMLIKYDREQYGPKLLYRTQGEAIHKHNNSEASRVRI
jgi:hypothetical protein